MKIYDVSQEVFGCRIYPGDPSPEARRLSSMDRGELYNLTAFSMCAHNGTHIDAPYHFINDGKRVGDIPLFKTVGRAFVAEHKGKVTASDAIDILNRAKVADPEGAKRILIKSDGTVTDEAARVFAEGELYLLGVEAQTVGDENAPMKSHMLLLEKEIVILEGLCLSGISEGVYLLSAAPINLGDADGAPCRALLIEL